MEQLRGHGRSAATMLLGLILSCIVTTVILLILAFVMLKLQPENGMIEIGILVTYAVSCFLGGWYCGRRMEKRKFLWGMLLGVLYFLLLFLISGMGDRAIQSGIAQGLGALALCAGGGMFGGMLAK